MSRRAWSTLAVLLLLVGLVASATLLHRSLGLVGGQAAEDGVCTTLFAQGCDATLRHPFSKQVGIPLAGWGATYFACVLLLLLLGTLLDDVFSAAAALLALVGGVASLALALALLVGAFPQCPLCLVANGANLLAVVPVVRWRGANLKTQARRWGSGLRYLVSGAPQAPQAARWRVVGLLGVALFAVVLYQWILIETDRAEHESATSKVELATRAFEAAPVVEIPISAEDPAMGPEEARATLVVFSDAFCPHCKAFWSGVGGLRELFGDDLRIVYKHFPLDAPCNPELGVTLHPMACNAGLALEAAREQGQFWAFHEALSARGLRMEGDPFLPVVEDLGLDVERFKKEIGSASGKARLEGDIATGNELGLKGTPAFYLNGRRVPRASPEILGSLIRRVLEPSEN